MSASVSVVAPSSARLADFIRSNIDPIIDEWVKFAKTRMPASDGMTHLALQDHIVELLTFNADDLETIQSLEEQVEKSQGLGSPILTKCG